MGPQDGHSMLDVDTSIAATHMMLEAWAQGIASSGIAWFDPAVVRRKFALPDTVEPVTILVMGNAGGKPQSPDRQIHNSVFHWKKWAGGNLFPAASNRVHTRTVSAAVLKKDNVLMTHCIQLRYVQRQNAGLPGKIVFFPEVTSIVHFNSAKGSRTSSLRPDCHRAMIRRAPVHFLH